MISLPHFKVALLFSDLFHPSFHLQLRLSCCSEEEKRTLKKCNGDKFEGSNGLSGW